MTADKIDLVYSENESLRGCIFKVCFSKQGKQEISISNSQNGHKHHILKDLNKRLTIICIGHLYAKTSSSFNVEESLQLLSSKFQSHDVQAVKDEIGGGLFILILIDHRNNEIFCLSDFLACMPFYYKISPKEFILGTNQFDLANGNKADSSACFEYLTYGYLPFHPSLFSDINRINGGQIISMKVSNCIEFSISDETYSFYSEIEDRVSVEKAAVEKLDYLFSNYFNRIGSEKIVAGLSGGYDSRLIAAYCKNKNIKFRTFNNPGTREAKYAQIVARALKLETDIFEIPQNSPSKFIKDFYYGMGTMDSLESSHVFANLDMICKEQPKYIIDGFLGGAIVGGSYFYKLKGGIEPLIKVLFAKDQYKYAPTPVEEYLEIVRSGFGKQRFIPEIDPDFSIEQQKLQLEYIQSQKAQCSTHADMIELLKFRIRGASLIAGGPVTFLRRVPTLCPFYDEEIFRYCMNIDKSLRAGHRLFNSFFRTRFPEISNIAKEDVGGTALQTPVGYRFTHFKTSLRRRAIKFLPEIMQKEVKYGGDIDVFYNQFLNNSDNKLLFNSFIQRKKVEMEEIGIMPLLNTISEDSLDFIRIASLACLLSEPI